MSIGHRLDPIFDFSSIAVVGASDRGGTGSRVLPALRHLGYEGRYYPVNSRADRVQEMQAYPNVTSLPEIPDMVAIAVPRDAVPGVIDECVERGVKAVVLLAAGFLERDQHGAKLQAQITQTARETGLLVVGPNCLGVFSVANHCGACSGNPPTRAGNVALVSHSGGLMNEVTWASPPRGVCFSHVVSAGNEAGVTAADYIDYFVADPSTDVILAIIEAVRDPEPFVAACKRALAAGKPIALLKMGLSSKGAQAAASHTGAVAGSTPVNEALFRQQGVIQVSDLDELVDMGALFSRATGPLRQRPMERAAIIEISGGGKDLVCDTAAAAGVALPELTEAGAAKIQSVVGDGVTAANPIDSGGSWGDADKKDVYPVCLDVFASEPDIDIVVSRYTIPRAGGLGPLETRLAELEEARAAHPDRFFPILSRTSDQVSEAWTEAVTDRNLAFLQGYGRGLRALGRLVEYSRVLHGDGASEDSTEDWGRSQLLEGSPAAAARVLDEAKTQEILAAAGIAAGPASGGEPGPEVVLGARRDPQFGPVVLFGLRSGLAEIPSDVAVRVAPLSAKDAHAMLGEIRGRRLLDGVDGQPVADRAAIEEALVRLGDLMSSRPEIVSIDINPAVTSPRGIVAMNARVQVS